MDEQEPRRKRPLILAGLAAVVAIVLGGLAVINPAGASDLATVRPLEPVVRLQQPGHNVFKPVTNAVATNQGARVETDASGMAEIAFFDGSLTRLGPNTDYELSTLDDESRTAIVGDLDLGRTYHHVKELTGSEDRFEVRTPGAVAAVRGTRFIVVCLANGDCIFGVIDGVIDVTSRSTGAVCVVRAAEEITFAADGSCSPVRPLDLDDPWVQLNLELDGLDIEELRTRLFGDDRLPATDDDPAPDEVDGDGDGVGDAIAAARARRGTGTGGTGTGGTGGGFAPGTAPGDASSGGPGDGSAPGDQVLGEVVERPGGSVDGGTTATTQRPGRPTTTTRPGQGNTTTTTRPRGTTTTRPGQGNTTTTRPGGTTSTTRPPGTTTTTRPGTTTTTDPNCTTGYPPRPC